MKRAVQCTRLKSRIVTSSISGAYQNINLGALQIGRLIERERERVRVSE